MSTSIASTVNANIVWIPKGASVPTAVTGKIIDSEKSGWYFWGPEHEGSPIFGPYKTEDKAIKRYDKYVASLEANDGPELPGNDQAIVDGFYFTMRGSYYDQQRLNIIYIPERTKLPDLGGAKRKKTYDKGFYYKKGFATGVEGPFKSARKCLKAKRKYEKGKVVCSGTQVGLGSAFDETNEEG